MAYLSRMAHRGLECRKPAFRPLHRYLESVDFPASDEVDEVALWLALYPSLTEEDVTLASQILQQELDDAASYP